MPVYRVEAIVIRRAPLGEADRVVTLFCREQGKVSAAARGVRRPGSRLAGRLELFSHVRALLAAGRTLDVVTQVEVVASHARLREDLERLSAASFAAEVVDRATVDRQPVPEVFDALDRALHAMEGGDPELAGLWAGARVLVHSGFAPQLDRCQVCGRAAPAGALSLALGGVVCSAHRQRDPAAEPLSARTAAALHQLLAAAAPPQAAGWDRRLREEVGRVVRAHLEYRLETTLRVPAIARRLALAPGRRPDAAGPPSAALSEGGAPEGDA
jgi:DNA repair protein RecO (recombination protein O)